MSDRAEEHRKRVIEVSRPHLICLDDGYWAYWIDGKGALKAHDLRIIADHLDTLNSGWDALINAYFDGVPGHE